MYLTQKTIMSTTVGRRPLKILECSTWMHSHKRQNDLCSFSWQTISAISRWSKSIPRPVTLKKLKLTVLWRCTRPFKTNTQKRCPFHYRGLECKSSNSRNTWSNRQIWPWSREWSRAKANWVLPRECTGHSKYPLPTREDSTHGHHQMANSDIRLIIFFAATDAEAL